MLPHNAGVLYRANDVLTTYIFTARGRVDGRRRIEEEEGKEGKRPLRTRTSFRWRYVLYLLRARFTMTLSFNIL